MGNILFTMKLGFCRPSQMPRHRSKRGRTMSSDSDSSDIVTKRRNVAPEDAAAAAASKPLSLDELKRKKGYVIDDRFEVMNALGAGSFGLVLKVKDRLNDRAVALKISKGDKEDVKKEAEVLKKLKKIDIRDRYNIVRMYDEFMWGDRYCVTVELLNMSLLQYQRRFRPRGLHMEDTTFVAYQLICSLEFLAHNRIAHCDLKPENIMVKDINTMQIKVIDFGSAEPISSLKNVTYFQTRFYRSPEVILGTPLSSAVDIWSLGCIMAELHTGETLFYGYDEGDQINRIVEVLGFPSNSVLLQGAFTHKFFDKTNRNRSGVYSLIKVPDREYDEPGTRTLVSFLRKGSFRTNSARRVQCKATVHENWMIELVSQMLEYDTVKRITAAKAKKHVLFHSLNQNKLFK